MSAHVDRASAIFCLGALLVTLGGAALAYPFAALSPAAVAAAVTPADAETLPDIDIGDGFGIVSVFDLALYYVENPPAPPAAGTGAAPARHFGGC